MPEHDFVETVDSLRSFEQWFLLSPPHWTGYSHGPLEWQYVPFNEGNRASIPDTSGVYAFFVCPDIAGFICNAYLMYIGKAGDKSRNNLRTRYGQYLSERKRLKRPHIHFLLNKWEDNLYFAYSQLDSAVDNIGGVEQQLLNAFLPPFSRGGYSAKVGTVRKGLT